MTTVLRLSALVALIVADVAFVACGADARLATAFVVASVLVVVGVAD